MEDLERHLALVLQVLGEEYGRHPAPPDLAIEAITAGQRRGKAFVHFHQVAGRRT
jgi:hypothetical protein